MKRPRWVSRQSPAQFFSLLQRRLPRDSFCGMSFMERPLLAQSGPSRVDRLCPLLRPKRTSGLDAGNPSSISLLQAKKSLFP
jgi:hypothetical protein